MDPEALSSDSHVAAAIATRRRSNSVSDDYSVQRTNDDATQSKYFAVQVTHIDFLLLTHHPLAEGLLERRIHNSIREFCCKCFGNSPFSRNIDGILGQNGSN